MLLSCRGIKKSFGESNVLNGVDLDIYSGDRIGLVGRNGAGKTTLANIICGTLDYDAGSIITTRQKLNMAIYARMKKNRQGFSFRCLIGNQRRMVNFCV